MNPDCYQWLNRLFDQSYLGDTLPTELLKDIRLLFDKETLLTTVGFLSDGEQAQVKKWVILLNAVQKANEAIALKQPFKPGEKVITPDGEAIVDEIAANGEDIKIWVKFGNLYSYFLPSEVKNVDSKVRVKNSNLKTA